MNAIVELNANVIKISKETSYDKILSLISRAIMIHRFGFVNLNAEDKKIASNFLKVNKNAGQNVLKKAIKSHAEAEKKEPRKFYQQLITSLIDQQELIKLGVVLEAAKSADTQDESAFSPIQFWAKMVEKTVQVPANECLEKLPRIGHKYVEDDMTEMLVDSLKHAVSLAYDFEEVGSVGATIEHVTALTIQEIEKQCGVSMAEIEQAGRGDGLKKIRGITDPSPMAHHKDSGVNHVLKDAKQLSIGG